jgi:hypothetical protein
MSRGACAHQGEREMASIASYLKPEKTYTEKQLAFLEAMANEAKGNIAMAAKIAGYSGSAIGRDVVSPLQDELIALANNVLATHSVQAAFGLTGVLDDPTALGAKNAVTAATQILDRVGIVKKEKLEVSTDGQGVFILPPKSTE